MRFGVRFLAPVLTFALLAGFIHNLPASAAVSDSASVSDQFAAFDYVSALAKAKSLNHKILLVPAMSEDSTVWVNVDGTSTVDVSGSPVRVRDDSGLFGWRDLDFDLVFTPDGVQAKSGLMPLTLSAGGTASQVAETGLVSVSNSSGARFGFGWSGALPVPVLDGSKATYSDVLPGVDLVVSLTANGFEQFFVLKQKPSLALLDALRLPLQSSHVSVEKVGDGYTFVSSSGQSVASVGAVAVWDADSLGVDSSDVTVPAFDPTVLPSNVLGSVGSYSLDLVTDNAFFDDPTLVYPVVIDPTVSYNALFDTYVQSDAASTDFSASTELLVGTYNSGVSKHRSFINFDASAWLGTNIVSASLKLWLNWSWSCTAAPINIHSANPASSSTRWGSQPSVSANSYISKSVAAGYNSSCAAATQTFDVTSLAQYLANRTSNVAGFALRASETDNTGWKRFFSSNAASHRPQLSVTFNHPPTAPASVSVAYARNVGGVVIEPQAKPTFTASADDVDYDNVVLSFYYNDYTISPTNPTQVLLCSTASVASGVAASCVSSVTLTNNQTYSVWAVANDVFDISLGSPVTTFKVDTSTPVPPTIVCKDAQNIVYANNYYNPTPPSSDVSCTITPSAATVASTLNITVDGDQSNYVETTNQPVTVTVKTGNYQHQILATTVAKNGLISDLVVHTITFGVVGVISPMKPTKTFNKAQLNVYAAYQAGAISNSYLQWRLAGETTWSNQTVAVPVTTANGVQGVFGYLWDTTTATITGAGVTLKPENTVLLQAQICFTYSFPTNSTSCSGDTGILVLRLGHAFGGDLPTSAAGPATVSLLSGEIQLAENDVNISTPAGSFTANRVYYSENLATTATNNGFGVGWVNAFTATDTGLTDVKITDGITNPSAGLDKVVKVEDTTGGVLTFQKTGASFTALGDETILSGLTLTISADGLTLTLVDVGGTKTTFTNTTPQTTPTWVPSGVSEPGSLFATCYQNVSNRLTKLIQKLATNTTPCSILFTTGATTPDVRVMSINYATATTASAVTSQSTTTGLGDVSGLIKNISYQTFDPATNTYPTQVQSTYQYQILDGMAVLVTATDNRDGTTTTYSYKTVPPGAQTNNWPQLSGVTQSGFADYSFEYSSDGYLLHVLHQNPNLSGFVIENSFVYNTPTGSLAASAPDLSLVNTSKWGQNERPVFSAIVYGADTPIASPAGGDQIVSNTLTTAQLKSGAYVYTDATGRLINTASYGLNSWLYTATIYNSYGLPQIVFAARELNQLLQDVQTEPRLNPQDYATLNRYSPPMKPGLVSDSTRVVNLVDSWSPVIDQIITTTSGTPLNGSWRVHTHNTYDADSPTTHINPATGKQYGYLTNQTRGWVASDQINLDPLGTVPADIVAISSTDTSYDLQTGADPLIDSTGSGWVYATPTKQTFKDKNGAVTAITINYLNAQGQITQSKGPLLSETENVNDTARVAYTTYYSAGVSSVTACQNKPAWVGLACQQSTAPPTVITTHPVTTIAAYTAFLQVETVNETATTPSATATRTTQNSYTPAGLIDTTTVTGTGFADNTTQSTHISYQPNGLPYQTTKTIGSVASLTSQTFDTWGRQTSFTNSLGEMATTSYKPYGSIGAGLIATYTDPQNSYSYTYGGLDANNQTDSRATLTTLTVNRQTYTAAYDNLGALTKQNAPNGLTQSFNYDLQGRLVAMQYLGTQIVNGNPTQQTWYNFARTFNENSQLATENKPTSATLGANATTVYGYDTKNHLINAHTTTDAQTNCVTNAYSFDIAGNRLTKTVTTGAAATCNSTPQTKTTSYNGYSQITDTGYVYDLFGRNTKIPAAATPTGASDLTLGYNLVGQVTNIAGVSTTGYSYDPNGNNLTETTSAGGVTTETTKHYFGSDTPSYTTSVTSGATTTEKYSASLGRGLNTITTTTGGVSTTSVVFTDLQGANFATTTKPSTGYATPPAGIQTFDEYGNRLTTTQNIGTNQNYGWAGSARRTTDKNGLILLGARVYNPVSGQFTTTDPVPGGNENAYNYPNNPVNQNDFTGCKGFNWGLALDIGLTVAMIAIDCIPVVGEVAMAVETGYAIYKTARVAKVVVREAVEITESAARAAARKAIKEEGHQIASHAELAAKGVKKIAYISTRGEKGYVGISEKQGLPRIGQHKYDRLEFDAETVKNSFVIDATNLSKKQLRTLEQSLMHRMEESGIELENIANSVAKKNWGPWGVYPKPH